MTLSGYDNCYAKQPNIVHVKRISKSYKNMSVREVENATRVSMYTIHKYIKYLPNKPITTSKRDRQVEFSRRRDYEASTLRTFCRLKARQIFQQSVVINQSYVKLRAEKKYKCGLQIGCKQIRIANEYLLLHRWYKFDQWHIS